MGGPDYSLRPGVGGPLGVGREEFAPRSSAAGHEMSPLLTEDDMERRGRISSLLTEGAIGQGGRRPRDLKQLFPQHLQISGGVPDTKCVAGHGTNDQLARIHLYPHLRQARLASLHEYRIVR